MCLPLTPGMAEARWESPGGSRTLTGRTRGKGAPFALQGLAGPWGVPRPGAVNAPTPPLQGPFRHIFVLP